MTTLAEFHELALAMKKVRGPRLFQRNNPAKRFQQKRTLKENLRKRTLKENLRNIFLSNLATLIEETQCHEETSPSCVRRLQ